MTALTRLSLRFRTVTLLLVGLLLAAGAWSVGQLNRELFPSLEVPFLVVSAVQPGAGPNAVAESLAAPIEEAIEGTDGLNHVASTSLESVALVTAEYEFGTDMAAREREVRDALAATDLPQGVATPRVERISPDSFPIWSVAVSGDDELALERFVTGELAPALEGQEGVGDVVVNGGATEVVTVVVDPVRLVDAGLSTADVATALAAAELSVPVGGVSADGSQLPVRVATSVDAVEEVAALPLVSRVPGAAPVTLGDVATVALTEGGAGQTISRLDGRPAIVVEVIRAQGANTVLTVDALTEAFAEVDVPEGIAVDEVVNQAPEIEDAVGELARDAVLGVVLAVLMILLFLRSVRATLVTGVSIPLSLLVAFVLMNVQGITLNILTLGALSVAAARVIDDAIVVTENIHRLLDEGLPRDEAVIVGTSQMVPAITASTLTTVAVFVPLAFVGGLVGEVFVGFALTVTFALLASLLVAVTVIPVLAQTFLKPHHGHGGKPESGARLRAVYRRPLVWALRHRGATVGIAVVLLFASLATVPFIPVTLFPASETDALNVDVVAAPGTSLATTSEQVAVIEAGLAELDGIERFATVVGTGANAFAAFSGAGGGGANSANIVVDLEEGADVPGLLADVEGLIAGARLGGTVTEQGGDTGIDSSSVSVQVTGRDFAAVAAGAEEVRAALAELDGLEEVTSNVAAERPELVVEVDPAAAAARGLDATIVAAAVRAALTPTPATTVELDGEDVQVVIATDPAAVAGPDALAAVPLAPGVVLGDVATVEQTASPTAVTRYDGDRSAEVRGTINDPNVGAVTVAVTAALDDLDLPDGVAATQGGVAELQQESFASLGVAMVRRGRAGLPLHGGDVRQPAHAVRDPAEPPAGRDRGVPGAAGDRPRAGPAGHDRAADADRHRGDERDRDAGVRRAPAPRGRAGRPSTPWSRARQTRLRPILMTASVTVLALVPLALGLSDGAILSASLATVVIGGLVSSTLLTLLVIPAVYSLFDGLKRRVARQPASPVEPPEPDDATVQPVHV